MNKPRLHRLLAWGWLALLLTAAALLVFSQATWRARIDTDLLALLPQDERRPVFEAAKRALSEQGERQLALLVSATDPARARQAAGRLRAALMAAELGLRPTALTQTAGEGDFPIGFYWPYRRGLLTEADAEWLKNATPEAAKERALTLAYAGFAPGATPWREDPFGFFGNWLQELGKASPLRPVEGELMLEHAGRAYVALPYTLPEQSAFDSDFQQKLFALLDSEEWRQDDDVRLDAAGVVLHAATAARAAHGEMNLIGLGSLLGALLLIGLVFQSIHALKLVLVSLLAGAIAALFVALAVFPRLHLLTLVFGASLIGVAVDYAILVYAQHLGSAEPLWTRYRRLLPTLCMVLIAPTLAYLGLALTPFPGLKQMAIFAVVGILGAWVSVLLFYPYLLPAHALPLPKRADAVAKLLHRWPRWRGTGKQWALLFIAALLVGGGLFRLETNDDIRSLFSGDPAQMRMQRDVSVILQLPSPAQMFLITARDPEQLLQTEERLTAQLAPFIASGKLDGFEAISRWLPSLARQQEAAALKQNLYAARAALAEELELPADWIRESDTPNVFLTPEAWFSHPAAQPFAALWLGQQGENGKSERGKSEKGKADGEYASMVLLKGLSDQETAAALSRLEIPGVEWIDQPREISSLMQRHRLLLTRTLLIACLLTPILLFPFFRRAVWRIVAPVLCAGLTTLSIMGYLGVPVQLLSILALLLTLGMGVDYALFLQARQTHAHTLLATTLAALLTLLSFGLLAFSRTPALHALGLTATLGVTLSWLLTPMLRKPAS